MTEKQFQSQVQTVAKLNGWMCCHTYDSRRSAQGFPDLVMVRGQEVLFVELKTDRGRVSHHQRAWLSALENVERIRCDLWRPADWERIVKTLNRDRNEIKE